jgi:outer membrane immunogenic protein
LPVPGLFWKTEYRVSEFNREDLFVREIGVFGPVAIDTSKKWVQTITTSLVWRFNFGGWGAPVAARY